MTLKFPLLSEEDRKRIEERQRALQALAPVESAPAVVEPEDPQKAMLDNVLSQMAKEVASSKQDPEMTGRWRALEQQSLDRLTKPQGYGLAQLARDLVPGAVGIIADGAFNRGRGLGRIAETIGQQATDNLARDERNRAASLNEAQQAAQIRAVKGENRFERLGKLASAINSGRHADLMFGNLLQRQGEGTRADQKRAEDANRYDYMYNAENPGARAAIEQLIAGGAPESIRGKSIAAIRDAMPGLKPQIELLMQPRIAGASSAASTAARIQTESQLAPMSADTEAQQAAARTTASVGAERSAQAANRPAPAGYVVEDPEIFDNANQDQASRTGMRVVTAAGHSIAKSSADIKELRRKYGTKLLPGGAQTEVETIKTNLIGQLAQLSGQGVVNPGERAVWDRVMPGLQGSLTDIIGQLSGADLKLDQLEGLERATRALVDSSATQYGLKYVGVQQAREARQHTSKWSDQKQPSAQPATGAASKWAKNKR